jgi:hypothetical protein
MGETNMRGFFFGGVIGLTRAASTPKATEGTERDPESVHADLGLT